MPQLPVALRKARAARRRAAGERALSRFLDGQVGRTTAVLIEKQEADGRLLGRSETFAPVLLPQGEVGAVVVAAITGRDGDALVGRSEENTSELQSLMRISYAVFCLKKTLIQCHVNDDLIR